MPETPADPPRIAVEPPAAPDPASGMGAVAPGRETAAEGLCRCGLLLPCPRHGQMEPLGSREGRAAIAAARRDGAADALEWLAGSHSPLVGQELLRPAVEGVADQIRSGEITIPATEGDNHD